MKEVWIFATIWLAMIAMGCWEASVEGRNPWDKRKLVWKIVFTKNLSLPSYHFYLFWVMWPLIVFVLPLIIYGWNLKLFGILISAYFSGMIIEDFTWYIVNPAVKLKEFYSKFSDYYPWLKIKGQKIIPLGYIVGIIIAVASWYFLWR